MPYLCLILTLNLVIAPDDLRVAGRGACLIAACTDTRALSNWPAAPLAVGSTVVVTSGRLILGLGRRRGGTVVALWCLLLGGAVV